LITIITGDYEIKGLKRTTLINISNTCLKNIHLVFVRLKIGQTVISMYLNVLKTGKVTKKYLLINSQT